MPNNLSNLDTKIPNIADKTPEESMKVIMNFLYSLLEGLRYALNNIDASNMNDQGLKDLVKVIREPISVELEDLDGKYAKLKISVDNVETTVGEVDKKYSKVKQTVDGLEISTNTDTGATFISGNKIQTGTIKGVQIEGSEFRVLHDKQDSQIGFYKKENSNEPPFAKIHFEPDDIQNFDRVYFKTTNNRTALKLESQAGLSVTAKESTLWLLATGRNGQGYVVIAPEERDIYVDDKEQSVGKVLIASPNGTKYEFRNDGIYFNKKRIVDNSKEV